MSDSDAQKAVVTSPAGSPAGSPADRRHRDLDAGLDYRLTVICLPNGMLGDPSAEGFARGARAIDLDRICKVIASWAGVTAVAVRVLCMTPADNCPTCFLDRLQATVSDVVDLAVVRDGSLEERLIDLINDLMDVSCEMALVLINLAFDPSADLQALIAQLVDDLPPQVHLYLVTDAPPSLDNIARLRVRRQLLEIEWAEAF
jgi:hypothetical protein